MTTINYKNGKIYKIEPICEHDEEDIYIGSTTKQYLCQRMTAHKRDYTKYKKGKYGKTSSFILFDKYGINNCKIILLELVEANSKDELRIKEAYYIKTLKCINTRKPIRSIDDIKEYKEQIKDAKKEYDKIYREQKKLKKNILI